MALANQLSEANSEERRENGLGLIMIGAMLWFFDLLVLFFVPAAIRSGSERPFEMLVGAAFVMGAALLILGRRLRRE